MITAAITAAVAAILAYFGVKPGVYLAGVAIVAKILVVASITGAMWWRQRAAQRKVDEAAQRDGESVPHAPAENEPKA